MPSATTTKPAMNGTKRKGAPVKDARVKHSKKPKTDSVTKSDTKTKKVKSPPVKKVKELSDSEDDESEGGVPVIGQKNGNADSEDSDSEDEVVPNEADGVHPERAKAAALSSMFMIPQQISILTLHRSIIKRGTCQTKATCK